MLRRRKPKQLGQRGWRGFLATVLTTALGLVAVPNDTIAREAGARPSVKGVAASLRQPLRLTAGEADQFLGVLSPDDHTLYFLSNRDATAQIYRQTLPHGTAKRLFSDAADVSWPRPSPDGTRLLYISTRDDATGDVCTRNRLGGDRRCWTDASSAENQAFWFPNGDVGVVSRRGLHGNLRLRRLRRPGQGTTLPDRNLGSPTVSPDGRWLVYVPLERRSTKVGVSFAMKLGRGLHLRRLDRPGSAVVVAAFDLPGSTGFPAFSRDGRTLYFAQHLSDTNGDGSIDGDDHSVLFRVPFQPSAAQPVRVAMAEQLTSARWNCQYPAPGRRRLVTTCLQGGSLDIYALPLDGAVPHSWGTKKLREALDAARDPWERLLLLEHLRRRERRRDAQVTLLRRMSEQHLRLGELSSTRWYANRAAALDRQRQAGGTGARGGAVRSWAAVMRVWVDHLRDDRRLDLGELDDRFVAGQWAHIHRLVQISRGAPAGVRLLATALRGVILDVIGRDGLARKLLSGLHVEEVRDPVALRIVAERVPDRLLALQTRPAALRLLAALAEHPRLSATTRLAVAERFVQTLLRGRRHTERAAALERWRNGRTEDSLLGFRLNLEAVLLTLAPGRQEAVRKAVFALYRRSREMPQRRALISATVRRAAQRDASYLLYQFSNSWASWVPRSHAERAHAEALYTQVQLERAYVQWVKAAHNKHLYGKARASFYGVTLQSDDLEAWIGFVRTRQLEGKIDAVKMVTRRFGQTHAITRFVRSFVAAQRLPAMRDPDERIDLIERLEADLQEAAAVMPRSAQIYHLRGYLAHQRLLTDGDRSAAIVAHSHYLMALDLSRGNARMLAPLLHAVGMLQADVGNHQIALGYFKRRALLPMLRPMALLSLRLAEARSFAHVGQLAQAAQAARSAVNLVDKTPALQRFLALTLDRAALWSWAAGEAKRAATLHRRLGPLTAGRSPASQARAWIIAVAAHLGGGQPEAALRALSAFDSLADHLSNDDLSADLPADAAQLRWHVTDLRAIADGLRAQALAQLKRPRGALAALARRRRTLQRRAHGGELESWRLLAASWAHSARLHQRLGERADALKALTSGLAAARTYASKTGTQAPDARLALLLAWARLATQQSTPPAPALLRDLRSVVAFLHRYGHPATTRLRSTLALLLTRLDLMR